MPLSSFKQKKPYSASLKPKSDCMLTLHSLIVAPGSRKRKRRVGRGIGSRGTYSGRGAKGQRSRTGGRRGIIRRSLRSLLERVPKQRGFTSRRSKPAVVSLAMLERHCTAGENVTPQLLFKRGIINNPFLAVKILSDGRLSKPLTVYAHGISSPARAALVKAGGRFIALGLKTPPHNDLGGNSQTKEGSPHA